MESNAPSEANMPLPRPKLEPIPPPTPQIVTPGSPKQPKMFLGFILGILFILLLGGGLFLFKDKLNISPPLPSSIPKASVIPTPDLTADWKIYTNKKYLYQFKYPSFYVETLDPEEKDIWLDYPGAPMVPAITININVTQSKPNDTLSGYAEESLNQLRTQNLTDPNDLKTIKTDEMRLGGEKAIKISYQKDGGAQEEIYIIHANYRYLINQFSLDEKLGRSEEFNQILSTFKFTDETNTNFVCPETEYVDCMPKIVGESTPDANLKADKNCSAEFLNWAKENCPNFKGAAY